ncbi:MAG TPA: LysR family transcriptional regulator [Burkholderiaceae bacterium]|nr:LysR family transcriptional regulator [Burkholderiaceae bacterium]
MVRPELLLVFTRVAELSSFTQAADSLGLPKASVSKSVKQLEEALGVQLLQRNTRRVLLTHDGQACYERCKDMLASFDDLQAMFRQGETLRGRLRVDMSLGMAHRVVLPRLPAFLALHPALEIELSSSDRRVDLVADGFDCVVRTGPLDASDLVARPLGMLVQHNLASRAYLAAHGVPQTLDDLAQHRLVHYATRLGVRSAGFEVEEGGVVRGIPMQGSVTVNNSEAYGAACLAGLGLIQAPTIALRPHVEAGELVEVLPQWRAPGLPVTVLYAHRRQLPARLRVFMDWLAEVLAPYLVPPASAN